jgi:ABC-2 type transport system ATP-binding protein
MSLISVKNLVRYYDNHCAVNDISFTLQAGDILGFLGPNGAGKSTTMQILSGNLAPSEGEILVNGIDLLDQPKQAKTNIGYLPEVPPLYNEMTVDEYLTYCAKLHDIEKTEIRDTVELAKKRCGLTDTGKRLIENLSKGYKQRTGIAQAILHSPKIIILDEPTVGLDPNQIREIRELITELGKEHGIILCTHILPEVQAVCNRVQIINEGKLVYEASMDQIRDEREMGAYEVSLTNPPTIDDLNSIDGVNNVEIFNDDAFLIHMDGNSADCLVRAAVDKGWGLNKLTPHQHTLEQIFVELTLSETDNTPEADYKNENNEQNL